ncbi:uncharacterized protein LOC103718083 [Phoenix dactylifera]|uniref:Uncharacterized protein LOC103718083 n=1 Tax=Phoenix dactylifera TaxID=42345 RepID=A0A8B7CRJ8_PHODC|nr:uncharacterized protein LOC103718083 [Phoenix dactylifera]
MKSVVLTPASASSSRARSATGRDRSEGRCDSCYFPGCRKDTNCHCEICLASINATRDLIPSGSAIQQSSLTKLSATKPVPRRPLVLFDPETPPATPESGSTITVTPPIQSSVKSRPPEKAVIKRKRSWILGDRVLRFLAGLCLLWVLDSGFSAVVWTDFSPKLTAETVKQAGEESGVLLGDLTGGLRVLLQKIERAVGEKVSDCSSDDSVWEFKQEGQLFFHWKCVIYKSIAEEVSVWGSPLRTSGLLPTGSSSRSLTLLSGRITEWSEGKLISTLRTGNSSSWSYRKWSLAALQLDADTWVLEYDRSALFEGSGLMSAACEVLRLRTSKLAKKLKHKPWRLLLPNAFPGSYYQHPEQHFPYPT